MSWMLNKEEKIAHIHTQWGHCSLVGKILISRSKKIQCPVWLSLKTMMTFCLLRVEKYEMRLVIDIVMSMSQKMVSRFGQVDFNLWMSYVY